MNRVERLVARFVESLLNAGYRPVHPPTPAAALRPTGQVPRRALRAAAPDRRAQARRISGDRGNAARRCACGAVRAAPCIRTGSPSCRRRRRSSTGRVDRVPQARVEVQVVAAGNAERAFDAPAGIRPDRPLESASAQLIAIGNRLNPRAVEYDAIACRAAADPLPRPEETYWTARTGSCAAAVAPDSRRSAPRRDRRRVGVTGGWRWHCVLRLCGSAGRDVTRAGRRRARVSASSSTPRRGSLRRRTRARRADTPAERASRRSPAGSRDRVRRSARRSSLRRDTTCRSAAPAHPRPNAHPADSARDSAHAEACTACSCAGRHPRPLGPSAPDCSSSLRTRSNRASMSSSFAVTRRRESVLESVTVWLALHEPHERERIDARIGGELDAAAGRTEVDSRDAEVRRGEPQLGDSEQRLRRRPAARRSDR